MSPAAEKIAREIFRIGVEYTRAQLRKDAANRYSLKARWILPLIDFDGFPAGDYDGPIIHLSADGERVLVWYEPFESSKDENHCDGATGVPDVLLGVDLRPGAAAHDVGYDEMEDIAKALGVPVAVVRKFFDRVFVSVTIAENGGRLGVRTVATVAYWAIRLLGGIYHKSGKGAYRPVVAAAALAAGAALLAGCGGCVQTSFEDPTDYVSPQLEKVC